MAIATLPVVLSVVLAELAIGGSFVMWLVDRGGRAPSGFLKLVAFVDAGAIAAALALVPTFPGDDLAARAQIDAGRLDAFGQALIFVTILVIIQLVTTFLPVRGLRIAAGILTSVAGTAVLGIVALARPGGLDSDPVGTALALAALPFGAVALGGTDGAMLLGHWYLVTPKLSPGPLRRASLTVVAAVALQIALVAIVTLRGDLTGTWETALSVALALRVGVGLFMTLIVALAAWWTAGMNTQSSTGLLYVALGCVFAGEVSARVIFFLTGVPI
ncbi:MAG TPA: hypothetical protein VKE23_00225 [Candidatus Limnocylindria bacterium]|nr:hypothetical protein [Candidatus Limnocylindria bacterium]